MCGWFYKWLGDKEKFEVKRDSGGIEGSAEHTVA
jgi:hypothetical protein